MIEATEATAKADIKCLALLQNILYSFPSVVLYTNVVESNSVPRPDVNVAKLD